MSLLIILPIINAENITLSRSHIPEEGIKIKFEIVPYGLIAYEHHPYEEISKNYRIVGDSFYYKITLIANEDIEDLLNIKVFTPNDELVDSRKISISLNKGQEYSFIPNSSRENSYLAIPFDLAGDYKIEVCSSKEKTFYREYRIWKGNYSPAPKYVWYSGCVDYFFDVMPQWQYQLNYEGKKRTEDNLKKSSAMLSLTKWLIFLTIILLLGQILSLWSSREGKKTLVTFILLIPSFFIFFIAGAFFYYIIRYDDLSSSWIVLPLFLTLVGFWVYKRTLKDLRKTSQELSK